MNQDFHNFLDKLSTEALETVAAGLDAAFPEPLILDPVTLSDERLRYDIQFRAGQRHSVRFIREYLAIRKSPKEE